MWDYHVILLQRLEGADILVWDLDTVLSFPCNFEKYFKESINPAQWNIPPEYGRYFRIIPCQEYLQHFSSDRSHMLAEDGTWMSPPPAWDPILKNGLNNIEDFISMDQDILKDISVVVGENEMYSQCVKLCSVE
ncbi:unnamed protein product [Nippostrongylus brasiliensis]|uniref:Protein N-terminal glutamine amidohydrolase n=1 Tax=Nippostrongylus brasiliensis TaxID=27835 RepID=A0A0N4Y0U2_NIPBR|nr:unnamed protein product [Nippostrongylus brasiliensis]